MTPQVRDAALEELLGEVERAANADPAAALELVPAAERAAHDAADGDAQMRLAYFAGFAHHLMAQDTAALAAMERSVRMARERGDRVWEARAVGGLGAVHSGFGDNESAIELLEQSLALRQELGDTLGVAIALNNLGVTFEEMGLFPDRARELLHEAGSLFKGLGHRHGMAASLSHLALLDTADAEAAAATDADLARAIADSAARTAAEAVAHARADGGNLRLLAETLVQEARALAAAGDLRTAQERLAEAGPLHARVGTAHLAVNLAVTRARVHRLRCEHEEAVRVLTAGLRATDDLMRGGERVALLTELVDVHEEAGDLALALAAHRELLQATLHHRDESAERRARALNEQRDLERARMEAEMERLRSEQLELANRVLSHEARHDGLTGLANRRAFDTALAARTGRPESTVTCVVGDLDRFKQVNDRFGHLVGDEVLRRVGAILTRAVRGTDLVARLGGEEFAVLLADGEEPADVHRGEGAVDLAVAGSGEHAVARVCERIRAAVAQADWSEVAPGLAVTISLGAARRRAGEPGDDLVARADALMYRAKQGGRDRVELDLD